MKDSFWCNVTLCNQIKSHNWEGQVMRSRCWFCFCHHTVDWFFITPCWLIEFDIVENKRRRRAGDIRAVYRVIINYSVFVSSARQSWQDRSSSPSFSRSDSCCDSSASDLFASDTVVWLDSLCDSNTDQRCDCYLELWLKNQPEELCKSKVKASDA